MKSKKVSNVFFLLLAFFALVIGLATGCGGSGGGGDTANIPPESGGGEVPADGGDPNVGDPPAPPSGS